MNPYEPPNEHVTHKSVSTGWLRRFLILNGALLAAFLYVALFAFALMRTDLPMQPDNISGDPVTYQHGFVVSVVQPLIALYVIPNLIFIAMLGWSVFVQRTNANE